MLDRECDDLHATADRADERCAALGFEATEAHERENTAKRCGWDRQQDNFFYL